MERDILVALFNNATVLLALSVIYEVAYLFPTKNRRLQLLFIGILISINCIVIMSIPFVFAEGINFDTRSILVSVTGLAFGLIPTAVTVLVAGAYRLIIGGTGALPGVLVIITSALIGLAWRRWLNPKEAKFRWLNILSMSLCVHIVMLACMLLLPAPHNRAVIDAIALPIMLIYPIATVLLSVLLFRQQQLKQTQEQLKQSEEQFKLLFDKAPLGYQSLDADGRFIEVNQQWCDLLGYTREEVIGRWFGDFMSPENREAFIKRFPVFMSSGHMHIEFELITRSGKPVFIAFEGKIGYTAEGDFKQTHCILQDITSQKRVETALQESERKYRNIAENVSDVVWQTDLELNMTYVSPSIERLFGETSEAYLKRKLNERFPEEALRQIRAMQAAEFDLEKRALAEKNRVQTIELQHYRADSSIIWVEMNVSTLRDAQGTALGFLGVSRDITDRKMTELALKESERSKSVLLSNLPGMAYRCKFDKDWTMLFASAGSTALTGYAPESLIYNRDLSFNDLILPTYRDRLWKEWEYIVSKKIPFQYEYVISTKEGQQKWVLELGEGVYGEDGTVEALEGIIIDITDRKALESKLKHLNEHDSWTGLYNLRYMTEILKQDLKTLTQEKRALVSINLSTINELSMKYGFIYSQNVIKTISQKLLAISSDTRRVFHTYENRFAFYMVGYRDIVELTALCDTIADVLRKVLVSERIGGGLGILEITEQNSFDIDRILSNLMFASERAVSATANDIGFCFFDSSMEARRIREQTIELELAKAAESKANSSLYLQFQAILDLKTNKICCFEALARLNSETLGAIAPNEFIPISEKTKLIIPLGDQIFRQSFSFLNKLKARGYSDVIIAINISIIQLSRVDFVQNLFSMMQSYQVEPSEIEIEITETIFSSNYQELNRLLGTLREKGIRISIDDFGTKYSSLSRESELKVDTLKIDRAFLKGLTLRGDHGAIIGDIITMAHKMGNVVIAEGVEYENQLHYLKANGCDMIQGYLVSKPLDETDALEFLRTYRGIM